MLTEYLHAKTLQLATGNAVVDVSYTSGAGNQYTVSCLLDPRGVEASLLNLVRLMGGEAILADIDAVYCPVNWLPHWKPSPSTMRALWWVKSRP